MDILPMVKHGQGQHTELVLGVLGLILTQDGLPELFEPFCLSFVSFFSCYLFMFGFIWASVPTKMPSFMSSQRVLPISQASTPRGPVCIRSPVSSAIKKHNIII